MNAVVLTVLGVAWLGLSAYAFHRIRRPIGHQATSYSPPSVPVSEVAAAKEYLRKLSMAGVITARPKEIA